ncbi:MAG: DciA family protein [Gammaproteobacteria bacterium]|nr:DciA family protein [Gammaproteobacteria bacterium]
MALERLTLPATLLAHIQRRKTLEDALRRALPEELGKHVFLLNVRGDTLVLGCDVQALITPLRFHAPRLLAAAGEILNEGGPVRVAWRTLPPPSPARSSQLHPRYPSPEIAEGIEAAARYVTDPALSSALHRLARAVGKRKPANTGR